MFDWICMADNDENNVSPKKAARKKCLLKKFFVWACLTIILLLIVGLIALRAPWTVVAVLVAVLLINTIVQKSIRKWIWLAVAIIVAAFVVWVFLPDDNEGWRPYTFDEELAAMEAKRTIPTEDNVATIYNQLLESHDSNSFSMDFLSWENERLILSEFWETKDYPEVASWLEEHQEIINQLMRISKKDKCRFPIAGDISIFGSKPPANFEEVTDFWWFSNKRITPMRHWSELLIISGNHDFAEGHVDQGLKKYITTLQMAKFLYQQPTHLDLLVSIAIRMRALNQINKYIVTGNVTNEQLQLLDNTLQSIKYDWRSDLHPILDREKLMFKSFMCAMFYQTNAEGRIRLNRDPDSALRNLIHVTPHQYQRPSEYWDKKITKFSSIFWWFFVPSTPQKTAVIIDDIQKRYYSMADPEYDWQKEHDKFSLKSVRLNFLCLSEMMSRILENDWPKIHDLYLRATTWKRASRLIIVLRHYKNRTGHWPESLEEIKPLAPAEIFVDPINNNSFVYKLTEKNFMLYSKGKNSINENGKREDSGASIRMGPILSSSSRDKIIEPDDILIWPPDKSKIAKNKKEKAEPIK